ncbi:Caspase domain-containing protein [Anaerobium acetethylicum]|uniref:Caspase domain-containing protein n=1 Tax=Anaerobium acetethylicum TaxID=1619234 RepID=A0A1D3TUZ5_9FIRM|nr:Caspase domain-containing protein [Anaerobium acetethylicum]
MVGIDDYSGAKLQGCVNDAKAVAEILEYNENGSKNFDVDLLTDISSKAMLVEAVRKLFSGNADVALFYFSGHGYVDEIGGYLVTTDFSRGDMGVAMSTVLKLANDSKCKNRIIILDSCYSGEMGKTGFEGECSVISDGVTVLTASLPVESAIEINGHGVFTSLLIAALNGGASNIMGKITPGSIYSYIDQALGAWQQRPVFKTNISQFVSIRDMNAKVPLNVVRSIVELFPETTSEYKLNPSYEFTNSNQIEHTLIEPLANEENVKVFKMLQKLEGIGVIEPVDEEHMYFAAMNFKSCRLTAVGQYYWKLAKDKRI